MIISLSVRRLYFALVVKVFISHSSLDQYIARTISAELERRGVETFLDAKDIETGDSLDDSIDGQLESCDELLMLLSPAALSSHWVLLEVGGAKALKKRLIPILIHVGPNDLPPPLAKGLARDLNEIERYFDEAQGRATAEASGGAPAPDEAIDDELYDDEIEDFDDSNLDAPTTDEMMAAERAEAEGRARRTFGVGDLVRIPEQPQEAFVSPWGMAIRWTDDMTRYAGRTATVTRADPDRTVRLDVDRVKWWAMDWLEPANT
ncbi:MAG TPA: TIR domain-containing protein [Solirubrobacteraceae bacterium]|jgi:hypothetical protein